MNQIINQLQNRKSVRVFTGEAVKDSDLLEIIKSSQQAPTSVNENLKKLLPPMFLN